MAVALRLQLLRDLILEMEVFGQAGDAGDPGRDRAGVFQPRGHTVVRQLRAIANLRPVVVRLLQQAGTVENQLSHDGQAVGAQTEGGEVGRKLLGQHREDRRHGVDGGGVLPRMAVEGRLFRDQRVDVGNGDQDLDGSLGQRFGHGELVQVARIVVVDRAPQEGGEIANRVIRAGRRPVDLIELGQGLIGKIRGEPAFQHRLVSHALQPNAIGGVVGVGHRVTW